MSSFLTSMASPQYDWSGAVWIQEGLGFPYAFHNPNLQQCTQWNNKADCRVFLKGGCIVYNSHVKSVIDFSAKFNVNLSCEQVLYRS